MRETCGEEGCERDATYALFLPDRYMLRCERHAVTLYRISQHVIWTDEVIDRAWVDGRLRSIAALEERLKRMSDNDSKINLGDRVRDKVTGFQGIVIGITKWLYQCNRPIVQPETLKDGAIIDSQSFDEDQLEVLDRGVITPKFPEATVEPFEVKEAAPVPTGGPMDTPKGMSTPRR